METKEQQAHVKGAGAANMNALGAANAQASNREVRKQVAGSQPKQAIKDSEK